MVRAIFYTHQTSGTSTGMCACACTHQMEKTAFLESNSLGILALCDTNLDDSVDSGSFLMRGYLPLIWKGSVTHMHGLAVYVKEGLPCTYNLSQENLADSYLCFQLALLYSVSYFFFLYRSPSSSLCTVFDSISSNIDEVLLINPSTNVFFFGDFNAHHKDWVTYSGGTDQTGELCFIFLSQMTWLRWLAFLLGSQTVILIVLFFWIDLFLLMLAFVLQWFSLHWEILIMVLSQFPLTLH